MDEADYGNERMEKWLEGRIAEHQHQLSQMGTLELGECRNCQTKLDDGRAFCDAECRADFDDRLRADKRNGKYRGG